MRKLITVATVKDWFDPDFLYAAEKLLRPNEKLYYISPDNFLALAKSFNNPGGSNKKSSRLNDLIERGERIKTIPYLRLSEHVEVDPKSLSRQRHQTIARVIGHEGRHRNKTLKDLGFKLTPVIVKFHDMQKIPKYVVNQDGTKQFDFNKIFVPYE